MYEGLPRGINEKSEFERRGGRRRVDDLLKPRLSPEEDVVGRAACFKGYREGRPCYVCERDNLRASLASSLGVHRREETEEEGRGGKVKELGEKVTRLMKGRVVVMLRLQAGLA